MGGVLRVRPRVLPEGWRIDRVLAGSEDVTDSGVRAVNGESAGDLRVVVTNRATAVAGSVVDNHNAPVATFVVMVFSDDATKWGPTSRFVATSAPDQRGRFRVPNLPPGTYRAVALEFLEEGAEQDPEVLTALRDRAVKFDLGKGESLKLSLPLTRVK